MRTSRSAASPAAPGEGTMARTWPLATALSVFALKVLNWGLRRKLLCGMQALLISLVISLVSCHLVPFRSAKKWIACS